MHAVLEIAIFKMHHLYFCTKNRIGEYLAIAGREFFKRWIQYFVLIFMFHSNRVFDSMTFAFRRKTYSNSETLTTFDVES